LKFAPSTNLTLKTSSWRMQTLVGLAILGALQAAHGFQLTGWSAGSDVRPVVAAARLSATVRAPRARALPLAGLRAAASVDAEEVTETADGLLGRERCASVYLYVCAMAVGLRAVWLQLRGKCGFMENGKGKDKTKGRTEGRKRRR